MEIGINLNIDDKNIVVSIEEARIVYTELSKLFDKIVVKDNKQNNKQNIAIKKETTQEPVSTATANVKETKAVEKKKKADRYSNPRVEAAKERATQRTSGCGARR